MDQAGLLDHAYKTVGRDQPTLPVMKPNQAFHSNQAIFPTGMLRLVMQLETTFGQS